MKIILVILLISFTGCSICRPGTEKNVQRWERKNSFRSAMIVSDSCKQIAKQQRMLAMARKY